MLTVKAPAKLNLTLEVLGKKQNGFHEIRSVIQTIDLCDTLQFAESRDIRITSDLKDWLPEKSLVRKAVDLVGQEAGGRGVAIEVSKRIPLLSGLGGDSSDAAATLRGLNRLWNLGLSPPELEACTRRLGSDVTYFLHRGTALLQGQGEVVAPLPPLPRLWAVLLVPPVTRTYGKTGRLYAGLEAGHFTGGQFTERMLSVLTSGDFDVPLLPLFNVFESIADGVYPGLAASRERFLRAGAGAVHLAGSGPALFALMEEEDRAEAVCKQLREDGREAYLAATLDSNE